MRKSCRSALEVRPYPFEETQEGVLLLAIEPGQQGRLMLDDFLMPAGKLLGPFVRDPDGVGAPVLRNALQKPLPLQLVDQRDHRRRIERQQLRNRGLALVGKAADGEQDAELSRLDLEVGEYLRELPGARRMGAPELEARKVLELKDGRGVGLSLFVRRLG